MTREVKVDVEFDSRFDVGRSRDQGGPRGREKNDFLKSRTKKYKKKKRKEK